MNPESAPPDTATTNVPPASDTPQAVATVPAVPAPAAVWRVMLILAILAVAALVGSLLVWQKLSNIQQQLARQSADSGLQATQAHAIAKQAEELAMETAAKLAVNDAKLAEVALQRTQLEDLMQSLSRSRDENLVVDIESAIRLAQQQTQLTGSIEPLLAALKSASARVTRASQPRLAQLQRAVERDIARIKATALTDTPSLLIKLDELVTLTDDLPLANAVGNAGQRDERASSPLEAVKRQPDEAMLSWSVRLGRLLRDEIRGLVRVSQVEDPDAVLLTPEQSFFVRENLKLRLLNARLGLLSRQIDATRSDLSTADTTLTHYFDMSSRKTQAAVALLQQIRSQMRALEIPRIDDTLAALATAAAGR